MPPFLCAENAAPSISRRRGDLYFIYFDKITCYIASVDIKPSLTAARLRQDIIAHRTAAMTSGLAPIFLSFARPRPPPIRKSVPVIMCLPTSELMSQSVSNCGASERTSAASRKPSRSHRNFALASDLARRAPR